MSNGTDFCRLLARDNTPIVTRLPEPEYLLTRFAECDYALAPERPVVSTMGPAVRRRPRQEQDMRDLKAIIRALEKAFWQE